MAGGGWGRGEAWARSLGLRNGSITRSTLPAGLCGAESLRRGGGGMLGGKLGVYVTFL